MHISLKQSHRVTASALLNFCLLKQTHVYLSTKIKKKLNSIECNYSNFRLISAHFVEYKIQNTRLTIPKQEKPKIV